MGVVCFSPGAVGALPAVRYAPAAGALLVFAAYAFGPARPPYARQAALFLLSICFAVTLFDLAARPLLFYLFEVRPAERYIYRWPPLPRLQRYTAGVTFEGVTYGDLAAISGRRDWREERRVRFVTDAYGFRNEPSLGSEPARPLDVIVLGDSFGVAGGTSQEDTLAGLLARDYGLSVYNLSISRENPLQQYANLLLEGPRLKTREGTCVLWLIFTGNDLDDPYYPELANPRPEPPGLRARLAAGFNDFRSRSPVRRLLSPGGAGQIVERTFVDGRRILFSAPYAERRGRTAEEVSRHPNFESLKATLDAMGRLAGESRLTVAVALVPSKEEVYSWALDGATPWSTARGPSGFAVVMRELCERRGFRFLDLKPTLVEASGRVFKESGALLWWRDDTHWNGLGQREAAAVIHESLLGGKGGQQGGRRKP
ncbi:MAG: hypothetical protein LC802_00020 [Acidobacteria bacterium]|nr:hypothetical protein [Acidobacteriota bacterium]